MSQRSISDSKPRNDKTLACALVCDHKLAIPAGGLAARIAKLWNVDVHIFVERPEGNRAPIMETQAARVTYHYEELFTGLHDILPDHPRFSRAAWGRIFIPEKLSNYHKILYCDVDVLPGPFPTGIEDILLPNGIAMVRDGDLGWSGVRQIGRESKNLPTCRELNKYHNSGVILFDPSKLDFPALLSGLTEFLAMGGADAAFPDQDFLNYFFANRVTELSPNLNFQQSIMGHGIDTTTPTIRHFCHSAKPYHSLPRYGVSEIARTASLEFHLMVEEAGLKIPKLKPYDKTLLFRGIKASWRNAAGQMGIKFPKERQLTARWWDKRKQTLEYIREGVAQGRFADANVFDLNPPEPQLRFNGLEVLPVNGRM